MGKSENPEGAEKFVKELFRSKKVKERDAAILRKEGYIGVSSGIEGIISKIVVCENEMKKMITKFNSGLSYNDSSFDFNISKINDYYEQLSESKENLLNKLGLINSKILELEDNIDLLNSQIYASFF